MCPGRESIAIGKITGEEDTWSHTDLWDFQANLNGAKVAYDTLQPLLEVKDKELSDTLATRFDALQADEVVRGGIEPALRLDVEHIGGLAAVVEEAPDGAGHEALRLAEDPGVLLEGADPGGLVVRTLDGDAEEGGHAGLHRLERDVAIARGLDVDAG